MTDRWWLDSPSDGPPFTEVSEMIQQMRSTLLFKGTVHPNIKIQTFKHTLSLLSFLICTFRSFLSSPASRLPPLPLCSLPVPSLHLLHVSVPPPPSAFYSHNQLMIFPAQAPTPVNWAAWLWVTTSTTTLAECSTAPPATRSPERFVSTDAAWWVAPILCVCVCVFPAYCVHAFDAHLKLHLLIFGH